MHTRILSLSNRSAQETALRLLQEHAVIIAPTDTVYGAMCAYDSQKAIRRLFETKQRPTYKAIPVLIGALEQLERVVCTPLPPVATMLAERFWPGPLTLILPGRKNLPKELTAGGTTVGVRMPDHTDLRTLLRRTGPLAATSANRSGASETCSAREALQELGGLVPLILSDDEIAVRAHRPLASTVLDISGSKPAIVRQGPIANQVLESLSCAGGAPC